MAEGAATRAITRWSHRGAGDGVVRAAFIRRACPDEGHKPSDYRPAQQQIHEENAGEGVFAVGDD